MISRSASLFAVVFVVQSIFSRGSSGSANSKGVADRLQSLLSDSRFGACNSNPGSPQCQAVRDETEKAIVDQQNQIDQDVFSSQVFMNATKAELISKVKQLKLMNETLMGSMTAPGLLEQYAALNEAVPQIETVMDGAERNIEDEIQKRGNLYENEMNRITAAQQSSADSARKAMLQLSSSNLLAQTAQIRAISNVYGGSLSDLGSQISELLGNNEEEISDLTTDVNQAVSNAQAELSVLAESAGVAREDAKAVAAAGNATFKLAESNLLKTAQAQLSVYKQYADALLSSSQQSTNQTLTGAIQDLTDKIVGLRGQLLNEFQEKADAVTKNITDLQNTAASLVPRALQDSNSLVDQATVKLQTAAQSASTSTRSVQKLTGDTSAMLKDLVTQIQNLKRAQTDGEDQAEAQFDQSVSQVRDSAQNQLGSMSAGLSDELERVQAQVKRTQSVSSSSIAQARDSYIAQLSGIQADSGQSSLSAVNAVSDANAASTTLGQLNAARLNAVSSSNAAKLNDLSSSVMAALQDANEANSEMSQETGERNRELELSAGQLVSEAGGKNSKTVRDLSQSVASQFADVQRSVLNNQKLSQDQVNDLRAAVGAIGQGASAVSGQAGDLQQVLAGMTADQIKNFENLFSQIGVSSSLISSSGAAAAAQLKGAVQTELNGQLSALSGKLKANADGVNSNINTAQSDASDLTDKLKKSSNSLSGAYSKTSSDFSALLATLSGANANISASSQSLNALMSSMTTQQIVQFQQAIAALKSDSGASTSNLRDYLNSIVANKTDSAKMEAKGVFFKNKAALTEAIKAAGSEISKTQSLAAQALLDNQIVRANSTLLFSDFVAAESKLANVSSDHATILDQIIVNVTNWKAHLEQRIDGIQAQIAAGSAQLPQFADEKLKNISALISMNQDDLKTFLAQFQDSLDRAKAIQDQFQDNQSARIISALTGVSAAITKASMRMASQVAQSDMSANDKARALTEVLSQLCNSIDQSNAEAASRDAAIAAQVRAMGNEVNGTVSSLAQKVNGLMTGLATQKLNKDISLASNMQEAVTNAGVGINASANALELAQNSIRRAVEKSSAGWADNNKNAYTLGGFLFSLSQQSQQKLLFILQQLQSGRLSMDQALSLAHQADISQIQSAQDVVSVLVGAMDGYDKTVSDVFGTGFTRLQAASKSLNDKVGTVTSDLVTLAAELDYNSSLLANRVDRFANISDSFINTTQQNVSDLESYIFEQQTQVTNSLNALKSLMDYAEKDVTLREQQFNNWIDSLIANETVVIANKTQALKVQLLGSPSNASSFLQSQVAVKRNMGLLKAEMNELDRRRHLRTQKPISVQSNISVE